MFFFTSTKPLLYFYITSTGHLTQLDTSDTANGVGSCLVIPALGTNDSQGGNKMFPLWECLGGWDVISQGGFAAKCVRPIFEILSTD